MQRVLSFQMARGFGESSEFVTKRMCFSFLFSVGFLCLLCGFLVGRFAAARAVDIRAEKTRLQLAGNGLENNEYLRENLIRLLGENSFDYVTNRRDEQEARKIKNDLLDLQLFNRVEGNRSCIVSTVRGAQEPDRHVVVSSTAEGMSVVMELSKVLKSLNEDYDWRPRRTISLMLSLETNNSCKSYIEDHVRENVVAYIELDLRTLGESGYFVATGSDIVRSSILEASAGVENPNNDNLGESPTTIETCREIICPASLPRLGLDIPNAALTFVNSMNSSSHEESSEIAYCRAISQIIGSSVWRLSEMTLFKWDPRDDNIDIINIVEPLQSTDYSKDVETLNSEIDKMTSYIANFNHKIDAIETTKSLQVRMANDLSMKVRRVMLCNDDDLRSRTDLVTLREIVKDSTSDIGNYLREISICYEKANELLQGDITR